MAGSPGKGGLKTINVQKRSNSTLSNKHYTQSGFGSSPLPPLEQGRRSVVEAEQRSYYEQNQTTKKTGFRPILNAMRSQASVQGDQPTGDYLQVPERPEKAERTGDIASYNSKHSMGLANAHKYQGGDRRTNDVRNIFRETNMSQMSDSVLQSLQPGAVKKLRTLEQKTARVATEIFKTKEQGLEVSIANGQRLKVFGDDLARMPQYGDIDLQNIRKILPNLNQDQMRILAIEHKL